jgi:hypothetical protein
MRPSIQNNVEGSTMRVRTEIAAALLGTAFALTSCGGSQPPATAPAGGTPPAPSAAAPAGPAPAWKDMNHEQRIDYMKRVVLPKMKDEFVAYDAKRYAEMNCATCHGDGAKDGTFKMPNPKLPKLPADEAGFKKLSEAKPEAMKFMGTKVVPDMANLLGEQPFDMKTHQGFGCFECHTK